MYEEITYDVILDRMIDHATSLTSVNIAEGNLLYTALAVEAFYLAQAYAAIDEIYEYTFADTCPREELIRRAKERGLAPREATQATVKAELNVEVEEGTRFSLNDLTYTVTSHDADFKYLLTCETSGTIGNKTGGTLEAIDFVEDIENAEIIGLVIPGADEEETETFRERYFATFDSQSFGGNRADYLEKIGGLSGVGGIKLDRVDDNGEIRVTILDSTNGVPSSDLIDTIQEEVDPVNKHGEGLGIAPIGHTVNVCAADGVAINVSMTLDLDDGYTLQDVQANVEDKIESYLSTLRESWEDNDTTIVRVSQIEAHVLNVSGVIDISGTLINNQAANITLGRYEVPTKGEIDVN